MKESGVTACQALMDVNKSFNLQNKNGKIKGRGRVFEKEKLCEEAGGGRVHLSRQV